MNIISGETTAPAIPVSSAERAKASVLVCTGLKPSERAAISDALTARMARPQPLLRSSWKNTSAPSISAVEISASNTAGSVSPRLGMGMPISPLAPPVRLRHSTSP